MLDEPEFRKHADDSLAGLKKSLYAAEDSADIEVEDQAGALHIGFEDGARFVISPNAPVRQIWISALTTSFKLDWSPNEKDFVLLKTGREAKTSNGKANFPATGRRSKVGLGAREAVANKLGDRKLRSHLALNRDSL